MRGSNGKRFEYAAFGHDPDFAGLPGKTPEAGLLRNQVGARKQCSQWKEFIPSIRKIRRSIHWEL